MGAYSSRPNIHLNLYMSKSDNPGGNSSTVFWDLQLNEIASQPTWSTDPINSASVSFSWWNGSTAPAIANFGYDFRPAGLQNLSVGSGSFVVAHQSNGAGGTVSGSASSTANILGTASSSASVGLSDYNRSPSWIDSSVSSTATRGTAYSDGVSANAAGSYSIVSGSLPPGIGLNSSNGVVSGTPTTVGAYSFTIRANGAFEGSVDTAQSITVRPALPVFSDSTVATATRGTAYSDGVSASEAASYSLRNSANTGAGTLPDGLNFNTSTGAITGTPTTVQSIQFRVRATNVTGSTDTGILTLTVNPATPDFTDSTVATTAIVGTAYSDEVSATEAASYSVFSGELPDGLSLNTSTGAITGTPTESGVFEFVIRATNVTGNSNTGTLTVTVLSGARVWNGTAFVSGDTKAWNGTAFVSTTTSVWNGSSWVSAT